MDRDVKAAFAAGYERMAAWSDLLDEINLYPVADADTGRNLRISLAPLKSPDHKDVVRQLLLSATGNSGNIAGAYFSKLISAHTPDSLGPAAEAARDSAWQAILNPKPGTMLSVFDAFSDHLNPQHRSGDDLPVAEIIDGMRQAVRSSVHLLPELRRADVVDAGALGMFLFFEGFLRRLTRQAASFCSPKAVFGTRLEISAPIPASDQESYCINTVIRPLSGMAQTAQKLEDKGEHLVTVSDGEHLKIHMHARDGAAAKQDIASMGTVMHWQMEKIETRDARLDRPAAIQDRVHIVTDAAGSLTREAARELGITLLESYIIMGDRPLPETLVSPETLYAAMERGEKITTAQASNFERHQYYESLLNRYERVVYLCVGSVYTGNYQIASQWAADNAQDHRMRVIDSTAASGRLGLIARHVARFARKGEDISAVVRHARRIIEQCNELIFLDQLKYLAAGGRISKTSGFFGDLFNIKPVISPTAQGAHKVGVVKNRAQQIEFALNHIQTHLPLESPSKIMLEYTDNLDWILDQVKPRIQSLVPLAEVSVEPMSLTSGVHMGPGTWGMAFFPGHSKETGYRPS